MKLKINATEQITLLLCIYSFGAILGNMDNYLNISLHLLATFGLANILYWLFSQLSGKKKNYLNTVISSLIIFLVLHYGSQNQDLVYPAIITLLAVASKFFLEPRNTPIINPVVLGLLLASLVLPFIPGFETPFISWWGTSYKFQVALGQTVFNISPALLLVGIWIIFGLGKWRKYPLLISFLLGHAILLMITERSLDLFAFIFTDATIYFFAAIMLIEPKTSPILKKQQIIFGIIAAIVYSTLIQLHVGNFELWAILAANVYFFSTKQLQMRKKQTA